MKKKQQKLTIIKQKRLKTGSFVLILILLCVLPLTVLLSQQKQNTSTEAWEISASAVSVCSSTDTAIIKVSFTNTETNPTFATQRKKRLISRFSRLRSPAASAITELPKSSWGNQTPAWAWPCVITSSGRRPICSRQAAKNVAVSRQVASRSSIICDGRRTRWPACSNDAGGLM